MMSCTLAASCWMMAKQSSHSVVCDLLGLHRSVSVKAREWIEAETGIPAANVMISGTHTHSAVNALGGPVRQYTSDMELTDYQKFVARRIADGVRRAMNLLRPAEIAFGTVDAPEHVFIRRWFLKEGSMPPNPFGKIDKVKMNPGAGNPNLVEPAGEPDPTVSFIALREPGGRLISVLFRLLSALRRRRQKRGHLGGLLRHVLRGFEEAAG
jgi:neutral ceramidase